MILSDIQHLLLVCPSNGDLKQTLICGSEKHVRTAVRSGLKGSRL